MDAGALGDQGQPGGQVVARLDVADQHPQGLAVVLAEGAEVAHGRGVGQGRRIGKGQRRLGARPRSRPGRGVVTWAAPTSRRTRRP